MRNYLESLDRLDYSDLCVGSSKGVEKVIFNLYIQFTADTNTCYGEPYASSDIVRTVSGSIYCDISNILHVGKIEITEDEVCYEVLPDMYLKYSERYDNDKFVEQTRKDIQSEINNTIEFLQDLTKNIRENTFESKYNTVDLSFSDKNNNKTDEPAVKSPTISIDVPPGEIRNTLDIILPRITERLTFVRDVKANIVTSELVVLKITIPNSKNMNVYISFRNDIIPVGLINIPKQLIIDSISINYNDNTEQYSYMKDTLLEIINKELNQPEPKVKFAD